MRASLRLRATAWLALGLLGLGPLAVDAHFSVAHHRWCQIHDRVEEVLGRSNLRPENHAPGWHAQQSAPLAHEACPAATAQRPATRTALVTLQTVSRAELARMLPPCAVVFGRAVLARAPKQGPPAA